VKARGGKSPHRIAFSPDGKRLAVGYRDVAAVDLLDGASLALLGGRKPSDAYAPTVGFSNVQWSRDGQTLFAAGAVGDAKNPYLLFA
jgi:dipeptidyl aminopeptidase/acylaminoacyl peptidase